MNRRVRSSVFAVVVLLLLGGAVTPASADVFVTPFIGVTFSPNADITGVGDFTDNLGERVTFGGTLLWTGGGVVGFEVDFGTTPNFFEIEAGPGDFDFGDGNVTTLMANIALGATTPGGGARVYGSGGVGLLRTNIDAGDVFESINSNDFGANFGGGVYFFFSDDIGGRVDLRYFRALQQEDDDFSFSDLDFWRASFGVSFRFGG